MTGPTPGGATSGAAGGATDGFTGASTAVERLAHGGSRSGVLTAMVISEAGRLLRHPLHLLGAALWALAVAPDAWDGPRPAFSALTAPMTLFWGVPVFFAAALVTSAARRAGAEELLGVLPRGRADRTAALCLAASGPFAAGAAAQALLSALYVATGNELERFPTVAELACGPLALLGAGLLGIAVARWAPVPGAPALAAVVLTSFNLVVNAAGSGDGAGPYYLLGFYADFAVWGPAPSLAAAGFNLGSTGWHAAYLLGLCAGAGALAMLADSPRRLPWLAVGAAASLATLLTGTWQLP
ncbi:hypothetical protein SAMN05660976_05642 [Nonomuraea pusilla]|uniref:ABC-2 type transport system permease protein n=2 Tax=Nonomuraea pusilla TaxID=46177 RepID=A0A1H7ZVP1_9ACTN|nr:hypothetical protein SAMN05660976_05642 [Nonomuraea pusilla]